MGETPVCPLPASGPFPGSPFPPRHLIREPAAEFLGTGILVMFGTAGNAQGILFDNTNVSPTPAGVRTRCFLFISFLTFLQGWLSVALGWGIGEYYGRFDPVVN